VKTGIKFYCTDESFPPLDFARMVENGIESIWLPDHPTCQWLWGVATAGLQGSVGRVASAGDNSVLARADAEVRPRPPPLAHPRRTPPDDRVLDRAHLQPPPTAARTRQSHPGRVRTRLHPAWRYRGMIGANRRPRLQQSRTRVTSLTLVRLQAFSPRHRATCPLRTRTKVFSEEH
jgi:hypothetical protein